jgi:hypothetical protein
MRFQLLPSRLRLYILLQPLLLVPLLYGAIRPLHAGDLPLLAALLFFTALFSTWKVELVIYQGRLTPVFATVCLAMLMLGPSAAVLCSTLGALVTTFVRPPRQRPWRVEVLRPRWYYVWFNASVGAISSAAAAVVYLRVAPFAPPGVLREVVGLTEFTTAYFFVNTLAVALATALQQNLPWLSSWYQEFLWTAPGFYASAAAAFGIRALSPWLGIWSLVFLPPVYLIYCSYRVYIDHLHRFADQVKSDIAQIEQLSNLNESLISSLAGSVPLPDAPEPAAVNRFERYALALADEAGVSAPERAILAAATRPGAGEAAPAEGSKPRAAGPARAPRTVIAGQHERWDGMGQPARLRGEEIPISGRIFAIAGMFELLTSDRLYRPAMAPRDAIRVLSEGAGRQFDPRLVELFQQVWPRVWREIRELEAQALLAGPESRPAERSSVPGDPRDAS